MYCMTTFFFGKGYNAGIRLSFTFRDNLSERIQKLILAIDGKNRNEKLQYNINREAAKISALSSGKTENYDYLTGEEILPSDKTRVIDEGNLLILL